MATMWITEYSGLRKDSGSIVPIPQEPALVSTTLAFDATPDDHTFNADTTYAIISADAAFHYRVGTAPTASTTTRKIAADTEIPLGVVGGHVLSARTA